MSALLFLLFLGMPLLELFVIFQVGGAIGGWYTAGLLLLFSVLGTWLLRMEGRRAWAQFRGALNEGRWPGDEVAQGALVIVGGALLVTPGFVTDAIGFLLLFAPTRRLVASQVRGRVEKSGRVRMFGGAGQPQKRGGTDGDRDSKSSGTAGTGAGDGMGIEVVEISREQPPVEGDDGGAGSPADR